jgi:fumarate hydratase class I
MTTIRQEDLIQSVADALQYISYYHPPDYIQALTAAYEREESAAAKDAMAQILVNSRMCAEGHRPICQDTGLVVAVLKVGMAVRWDAALSVQAMVDEGVRRAYTHPDNVLRASMVAPPIGERRNTGDNTPAIVHVELVPGAKVEVKLAAKGGGSENKARFAILNPSDSLVEWVLRMVPTLGAGWCPPGMLGIGIGGSAEKAMLLYDKVNALGIGAQGLGGLTTVLDVKLRDYPTHAASLPVAIIPNCAATRHVEFVLDGRGPVALEPPSLSDWPQIAWEAGPEARRVDLDRVTREEIARWRPGDRLLLSGRLLTGRDAAHKRIADLLDRGKPLPNGLDLANRFIYYVGPVDPVRDEVVGPAGPTTATRMDKFTDRMLAMTGLIGMIGKAERGPAGIEAIRRHRAVYLIAVGGAAYLVSKAIKGSRLIAFEDLGMEAVREFEVGDMPVTVAVDAGGDSVHETGPAQWRGRIGAIPVVAQ